MAISYYSNACLADRLILRLEDWGLEREVTKDEVMRRGAPAPVGTQWPDKSWKSFAEQLSDGSIIWLAHIISKGDSSELSESDLVHIERWRVEPNSCGGGITNAPIITYEKTVAEFLKESSPRPMLAYFRENVSLRGASLLKKIADF